MSIYEASETYKGKLPTKYQNGDKVQYQDEKATIVAVEVHENGDVMYLVRSGDDQYGGVWCNSKGFSK